MKPATIPLHHGCQFKEQLYLFAADIMNSPLFSSEISDKEEKEKCNYVPFRTGADVIENFDRYFQSLMQENQFEVALFAKI